MKKLCYILLFCTSITYTSDKAVTETLLKKLIDGQQEIKERLQALEKEMAASRTEGQMRGELAIKLAHINCTHGFDTTLIEEAKTKYLQNPNIQKDTTSSKRK